MKEYRCNQTTRRYLQRPQGRVWLMPSEGTPTIPLSSVQVYEELPDGLVEVWDEGFVLFTLTVF